jgi:fatty-acyl-CoA synthase
MATGTQQVPSYAHGASSAPLLGETIGANLERTAARFADRPAIVSSHQDVRLSYAEFDAEVDRVARALLAAGFEAGERIGIWSPNRVEWALVQYATAKVGVILVNINPAYRTQELQYALRQSGCRTLIAAESFKSSDYAGMLDEVRGELPELERAVFFGTPSWDELLAGADAVGDGALHERSAGLDPSDPINIQYTSGTTGFPKGATLSHHNILNNGFFVGEGCRITEQDRICVPVPYYHCFGMVMGNLAATSHGACVVLPAPAFEPGAVLDAVQAERCTVLYGVPTMFIAELDHPDFESYDLSSLRTGIMAGSPCPVEVMRKVVDRMHMSDRSRPRPARTTISSTGPRPSGECTRTWRSAWPIPRRAARSRGARRASSRPAGTASCSDTGTTPSGPPRRSTRRVGCTRATRP